MTQTSSPSPRQSLGQYLVDKEYITKVARDAALKEQLVNGERLGRILVRNGFITNSMLMEAILATDPAQIHSESLFTSRVPSNVLIENRTMVVYESESKVYLATLLDESQAESDIREYYPEAELVFVAADFEKVDNYIEELKAMESSEDSLLDKLLRRAFAQNISDIHIVARYNSYTVLFRRNGHREHAHEGTLDEFNTLAARIKDMARMDLAERRIPQDGAFQMEYNGKQVDLRVATNPQGNSESLVIRLLDPDRVQPTLAKLGITRVEEWRKGVSRPNGLCLICGPTGSGKTSTLNASFKEMDRFGKSIFTIEDPVEYRIPYLVQVNKNETLGLDFARAIRAFMRSDPDVIGLGEIRDEETARNAIKAAETGHLVLGTLHTGNIIGAVNRLRDLGVPAHELVYQLRTVLVQRLIRTLCTHCHGDGCKVCHNTGFGGRTVVSECAYFRNEEDVQRMIDGERWWPSMLQDALLKANAGVTTEAEVVRVFGAEAEDAIAAIKNGTLSLEAV